MALGHAVCPCLGATAMIRQELDACLRFCVMLGALAVVLLPAARGHSVFLGWLPLWLLVMPLVAWWSLRGWPLPKLASVSYTHLDVYKRQHDAMKRCRLERTVRVQPRLPASANLATAFAQSCRRDAPCRSAATLPGKAVNAGLPSSLGSAVRCTAFLADGRTFSQSGNAAQTGQETRTALVLSLIHI